MNFYSRLLESLPAARQEAAKTYPVAQKEIFDFLRSHGWTVSGPLKVPWAEDRAHTVRLWFKPQAVWMSYDGGGRVSKDIAAAHSMFVDIRKETGESFLATVDRWKRESAPSPSASLSEGVTYSGKVLGKDCRLRWNRSNFLLEELPAKGKRSLRIAHFDLHILNVSGAPREAGWFIPENLLRDAKLPMSGTASEGYEALKKKIMDVAEDAAAKFVKLHGKPWDWVQRLAWTERAVNALQVEPEGMGPIQIGGKDFTITCQWTDFKVYSPNSDLQQAEPHYTYYSAQSPTAARIIYKKLRAEPNALKSVPWDKLADWLAKNGVSFKTNFSRWS